MGVIIGWGGKRGFLRVNHPPVSLLSATAVFSIRANWCKCGSATPQNKEERKDKRRTTQRERDRDSERGIERKRERAKSRQEVKEWDYCGAVGGSDQIRKLNDSEFCFQSLRVASQREPVLLFVPVKL